MFELPPRLVAGALVHLVARVTQAPRYTVTVPGVTVTMLYELVR